MEQMVEIDPGISPLFPIISLPLQTSRGQGRDRGDRASLWVRFNSRALNLGVHAWGYFYARRHT